MLYREIKVVCSEIHTKHINTLCGQNVEFCNVEPGGVQSVKLLIYVCLINCLMKFKESNHTSETAATNFWQ